MSEVTNQTKRDQNKTRQWILYTFSGFMLFVLIFVICVGVFGPPPPSRPSDPFTSLQDLNDAFDIISQRWMAISSVLMVFISFGTLVLLAWTLNVTRGMLREASTTTAHAASTLDESKRSANAAEASVETNKDLARKQAQAYVHTIGMEVTLQNEGASTITLQRAELTFRNDGQTPATNVSVCWRADQIAVNNPGYPKPPDFQLAVISNPVRILMAGKEDTRSLAPLDVKVTPLAALRIFGQINYRTVFGEYVRTQFCYQLSWAQSAELAEKQRGRQQRFNVPAVFIERLKHFELAELDVNGKPISNSP